MTVAINESNQKLTRELTPSQCEEVTSMLTSLDADRLTPFDVTPFSLYSPWFVDAAEFNSPNEQDMHVLNIIQARKRQLDFINSMLASSLTKKKTPSFARQAYAETDLVDTRNQASNNWDKHTLIASLFDRLLWHESNQRSGTVRCIVQPATFVIEDTSTSIETLRTSFTEWPTHLTEFVSAFLAQRDPLQKDGIEYDSPIQSLLANDSRLHSKNALMRTEMAFVRAALGLYAVLSVSRAQPINVHSANINQVGPTFNMEHDHYAPTLGYVAFS